LIRLVATANETDAAAIRDLLSRPDEHTAAALVPYLEQSDALEYTRQRAAEFAAAARAQLAILPASPAKRILEAITDFVADRSF
jgi:octaprenyl-diphosphate synthase